MEVMQGHQYLLEEMATHFVREDARVGYVAVELSSHNCFLDDVSHLFRLVCGLTILVLYKCSIGLEIVISGDEFVAKL